MIRLLHIYCLKLRVYIYILYSLEDMFVWCGVTNRDFRDKILHYGETMVHIMYAIRTDPTAESVNTCK